MALHQHSVIGIISFIFYFMSVQTQFVDVYSNYLYNQGNQLQRLMQSDQYMLQEKYRQMQQLQPSEKVKIQVYYECLCPDCRVFDTQQLAPTVKKIGSHLDIHTYPYGNAHPQVQPNGQVLIMCQHGPAECYGNKLHACAIDSLQNMTSAVLYNACMMDHSQNNGGSDDEAADRCGRLMNVDSTPIKNCAKSSRGDALLRYYGDESKKVTYPGVPYILINGAPNSGDNFFQDVCAAFRNPPKECFQ